MPIGLFGNKSDLKERRALKQEDIDNLCKKENFNILKQRRKKILGLKKVLIGLLL